MRSKIRHLLHQRHLLRDLLLRDGVTVTADERHALSVTGLDAAEIGLIANQRDLPLLELTTRRPSLEKTFMELTHDAVDYDAHGIRREAT